MQISDVAHYNNTPLLNTIDVYKTSLQDLGSFSLKARLFVIWHLISSVLQLLSAIEIEIKYDGK